jgi:hypothetical protein
MVVMDTKNVIMLAVLVMAISALIGTMATGTAKAGGFADGKRQESEDSQAGTHDDHCGYGHDLSYCAAYKLGYEGEWAADILLHDR